MNRHSPLLLTILLVMTMLGHSAHNAIAAPQGVTSTVTGVSTAAVEHAHGPLKELRVVQHGALATISPEICTVGEQAAPLTLSGSAHFAILAHDTRDETRLPNTPSVSAYESPAWSPDVRRALLQVFLN